MNKIAHISDLHFGDASETAIDALRRSLIDVAPDVVVVTGDLTQSGRRREFDSASAFLNALPFDKLVIPGNHDVPVRNLWARFTQPYGRFTRTLGLETDPVYQSERLTIIGLNSARRAALDVNWSYGRLSSRQIAQTEALLARSGAGAVKTIATHHPYIKGEGAAGARIVGRGRQALRSFSNNGADMILTGHVHRSRAETLTVGKRSMVIIEAGTAASGRQRGEPLSYNVIKASPQRIAVTFMHCEGRAFGPREVRAFQSLGPEGWRAVRP